MINVKVIIWMITFLKTATIVIIIRGMQTQQVVLANQMEAVTVKLKMQLMLAVFLIKAWAMIHELQEETCNIPSKKLMWQDRTWNYLRIGWIVSIENELFHMAIKIMMNKLILNSRSYLSLKWDQEANQLINLNMYRSLPQQGCNNKSLCYSLNNIHLMN